MAATTDSPDYQLFTSLRYDPVLRGSRKNLESWPLPDPGASPFYLLSNHRDRLLYAAQHFQWDEAVKALQGPDGFSRFLQHLEETVDTKSAVPIGVKVLVNRYGDMTTVIRSISETYLENLLPTGLPAPASVTTAGIQVSPLTGGAMTIGQGDSVYGFAIKDEPYEVVLEKGRTLASSHTSYKTTARRRYDEARAETGIEMGDRREVIMINESTETLMEGSISSIYLWRDGKWTTPPPESGGQRGTTRRWLLEHG